MQWTLLAIFVQAALAAAAPTLVYPLADQFPPVGRVDKPFDFALLPGTFNSSSTIAYTTSTLPSWLTFDPVAVTFFGTPTTADLGQMEISLTASDGSKTSDSFTLFVTDAPAPGIHLGIQSQIANPSLHNFATAIPLPSHTGVTIHPYYSFSLGFQASTFRPAYDATPEQSSIYYTAHERGHVVLPTWLTFDNHTVTFYGTAPADGSYTIVMGGSDFWGYGAVETSFVIEVGTSSVDFVSGGPGNITTVAGAMIEHSLNLTGLAIDGQVLTSTNDISVQADLNEFKWLTFDK
jgi:axial budding pattern protein 2